MTQFKSLSNQLRGLVEFYKLNCFLSRLIDNTWYRVRLLRFNIEVMAFGLAKLHDNYVATRKEPRVDLVRVLERVDCNPSLALTTPKPNRGTTRFGLPIQRVTPAQLKKHRANGLRYYGDEK